MENNHDLKAEVIVHDVTIEELEEFSAAKTNGSFGSASTFSTPYSSAGTVGSADSR